MKANENDHSRSEPTKQPTRVDGSSTITEFRVLVSNEESSVLIGRKGVNADRIRKESGAFLSILKQEGMPMMSERVMVIKGLPSQIHTALNVVVTLLAQNLALKAPEAQSQVTVKLLIHKFLAGCIIGPAGAIMREIQNAFAVRVSVSTEALPGSTEKTCSIIGPPAAICAALERVIDQLTSNPLRPGCSTVLYVPGAPFAVPGPAGYGAPISGYPPDAMFRSNNLNGARGSLPSRGGFGGSVVPPHLQKSEKVIIPDSCSGVVIGKGGAIIKHIKARTDTNISLGEPDEAHDRVVTIAGSPQGIQAAIAMIRERVENYHPMREIPRYQ